MWFQLKSSTFHEKGGVESLHLLQEAYTVHMGACQNYGDYIGIIVTTFGFYGDNGKENGNYYIEVIYTLVVPFRVPCNIRCRIIIGIQP